MDDIKHNISDNQYKIIMDNFMDLNNATRTQDDIRASGAGLPASAANLENYQNV
jgi:hypothetical protein